MVLQGAVKLRRSLCSIAVAREEKKLPQRQQWLRQALEALENADADTPKLDSSIFARLLEICASTGQITEAKKIHSHILRTGLQSCSVLGSYLVRLYLESGMQGEARRCFDEISCPDSMTFARMIRECDRCGDVEEGLRLFRGMQQQGVTPDSFAFIAIVTACSTPLYISEGRNLHSLILHTHCASNTYIATALVNLYGKCERLKEAKEMFDGLDRKRTVSWNAIISAHTRMREYSCAVKLLYEMQLEGMTPDKYSFCSAIEACACDTDNLIRAGECVHALVVECGLDYDAPIATSLIKMYGNCGDLECAEDAFERVLRRDSAIVWTAFITANAQQGHLQGSMHVFRQMQNEGLKIDWVAFLAILNACDHPAALPEGRIIHNFIINTNLHTHTKAANALVSMYAKCGSIKEAYSVFAGMPRKDVVTWNIIIAHSQEENHGLIIFFRMLQEGVMPDKITFINTLTTICAGVSAVGLRVGRLIHGWAMQIGIDGDPEVCNAIVNMYGSCGCSEDAVAVFERMKERDRVAWNVMIAAHTHEGMCGDALRHFYRMQLDGFMPDRVTFVSILTACGLELGVRQARRLHLRVLRQMGDAAVMGSSTQLGNAVVSMYGKCGAVGEARRAFEGMSVRDVVTWNGMIAGYAAHGEGEECLKVFRRMYQEGVMPNEVTFVSVLAACGHVGLVEEGGMWFGSIAVDHVGVVRRAQHYNCMADMLGRIGDLSGAERMIREMPYEAEEVVWVALLGACRVHGNVEMAARTAEMMFEMFPKRSHPYVMLAGMYAEFGMHEDAAKVRKLMSDRGLKE